MQKSTPIEESINSQEKTVPESDITKHVKYVIIGGGISAIQAALILAEHQQDFIILEASNRIGGRICTLTIGQAVDEHCYNCDFPWLQQDRIRKLPIECGATWVSEDQPFMNHLMKQYGLNLYAQNQKGKHALALDKDQYLYFKSLGQYYNQHRPKILKLFSTIKKYTNRIDQLSSIRKEGKLSEQQQNQLKSIFDTYDTMTAFDFIQSEVEDEELGKLLCKQIQTLQSANCRKFTAVQLFTNDEQSSLANVRFYVGQQNANIDGFRVQQGNSELVQRMKNDIQLIYDKQQGNGKNIDNQIKLNTPVIQVKNHQSPVIVITKNGEKYSCEKAIICLPAATFGRIQFSSLSAGKKLIVQNQITGNATRMAMIFKQPWWRPDNTGYASFSHKFPMNEFVDLTPEDECIGILAFVFLADGFESWNQQILAECGNAEGDDLKKRWYQVNMKKAMRIVADVYMKGDIESEYLKEVAIFTKSLSQNPYIKSTYDATTGPGVFKDMFEKGLDTTQAQLGDQKNIVILGSDFSDEHCGYMEGAIRIARKKIYSLCGSKDPLEHLKDQH